MMISCEAGAYNTIDLAWIVSRKKPLASRPVRLRLPFNNGQETNELELMNATFDEKSRELVTLAKGRGLSDCGIQARWRFDGQRFRLVRYAADPPAITGMARRLAHVVDHPLNKMAGTCRSAFANSLPKWVAC
nr:DUF1176 domain-containing protein [Escherichia coli]